MFEDTLEADIKAAIAESSGAAPPTTPVDPVIPPTEPVEDVDTGAPSGETDAERQVRIDEAGRARDQAGKFAAKPAEEGAKPPETAKAPEADKPLVPPADWTPQAKADFLAAPKAVQQQILKREEELANGAKEWQGAKSDFERLDKVIGPHRDRWMRDGKTPDVAIGQLLAAEKALQGDPTGGTVYLLQTYAKGKEMQVIETIARANGYTLTKATTPAGQPTQDAPGASSAQVDPATARRLDELEKQNQAMTRDREQREAAERSSHVDSLKAEVNAFATAPENLFFENVRKEVYALVKIGDESGDRRPIKERLQEAYDKAVWANPTTRELVRAAEQKKRDDAANAVAARKAEAARNAAGSVTGAPGEGQRTSPKTNAPNTRNLDDDITADIKSAMASGRA